MKTKDIPALTNHDIDEVLSSQKCLPKYRGCFMTDQIPMDCKGNGDCGVINLDNEFGKSKFDNMGFHWTAWYVKDKTLYYCDSYGGTPTSDIIIYALENDLNIRWNPIQFQTDGTSYCGLTAIWFIMKMANGCNFDDIIKSLKNKEKK